MVLFFLSWTSGVWHVPVPPTWGTFLFFFFVSVGPRLMTKHMSNAAKLCGVAFLPPITRTTRGSKYLAIRTKLDFCYSRCSSCRYVQPRRRISFWGIADKWRVAPTPRPASIPSLVLRHHRGGPEHLRHAGAGPAAADADAVDYDAAAGSAVDSPIPAAFQEGCEHFVRFSSLNCSLTAWPRRFSVYFDVRASD